ncbi:hypothetical protein ACR3QJ_005309 [Citrobacter freundii]
MNIDITTMRGEIPRDADGLLPQSNSTYAENCHFDCGVVTPLTADIDASIAFTFTPLTVFHYFDDYWFAWDHDVNVIRSPIAQDPYNRIYYTDGEYPKLTSADIALVGDNLPSAYYRLGVPAPETAIGISAVTPPNDDDGNPVIDDDPTNDETRYYCETYVTAYGEEGPPGTASADVEITAPGSSVTLSLAAPPAGNYNITRRRIYRTVTTTSDAEFLEVVELDISVTSYVDSLTNDELTATLETEDYLMPPDSMIGLCAMNNGISVGFAGNEIMFSMPYLPYAWPDAYKLSTYDNIVAIASVDTAVVVGTEGVPVVFSGITPSNISDKPVQLNQACLSKRSMVSMLGFVLYAGPAGIVKVTATGAGTRSLLELSSVFLLNANSLDHVFKKLTFPPNTVITSEELDNLVAKMIWGTRYQPESDLLKQTNIMTSIQKIAKNAGAEQVLPNYEFLCDIVHPSFIGNTTFWSHVQQKYPDGSERRLMSRLTERTYNTEITDKTLWALGWSTICLQNAFVMMRNAYAGMLENLNRP